MMKKQVPVNCKANSYDRGTCIDLNTPTRKKPCLGWQCRQYKGGA